TLCSWVYAKVKEWFGDTLMVESLGTIFSRGVSSTRGQFTSSCQKIRQSSVTIVVLATQWN
ncbi:hypothetical protein N7572_09665, partial [Enterobacter roggenkampii]|uniref:hypothetical protein n=1 Tax=Enterobacter roggenkampii TaxID=1812935 RepID=UPI00244B4F19